MIFSAPDWGARLEKKQFPLDLDKHLSKLNQSRVEKVVEIFGRLKIPDVPGQPTNFDATGEWFFNIARLAAGGLSEDGTQKVQTLLACVSKKQGKTSSGAGLMIALILMSPRPNAEFLLIGPTQAISDIAFRQASGIILADGELRKLFRIREHLKRIEHIKSGCFLSVKSFDPKTVTGTKASLVLLDECHLLSSDAAVRIVGQIRGAGAAIKESQLIMITTHSDQPAAGFWRSELSKARKIRDGELDVAGYVPLIWEPPAKFSKLADVCQPDVWEMTNPNMGRSVDIEWLKRSFTEALADGEDETKRWLSQHCNVEISSFVASEDAWSGADVWALGAQHNLTLDWIMEHCQQFALGFDGGGADDLASLAVIGIDLNDIWYLWVQSWLWPIALERRKSIAGLLKDFEAEGHLHIAEAGTEVREVVELALRCDKTSFGELVGIGSDPNGIAGEIAVVAESSGIEREKILSVTQGFRLRPGWLALERRIRQGTLKHGNQAILNWAVSNTKQDPNSGLVTKKASGIGKIDPAVAAATAAMIAMDREPPIDVASWIA